MSTDASVPGFGFEQAWTIVAPYYDTHGPTLRMLARKRLLARSVPSHRASVLAHDIVADALLGMCETIQSGECIDNKPAWLNVVVQRAAIKVATRSEGRLDLIVPPQIESSAAAELGHRIPDAPDAASEALDRAQIKELRAGINSLGEMQRTVLVLAFEYDLNSTEIAERLGIRPGTVRGHKRRALLKLSMYFTANGSTVGAIIIAVAIVGAGLLGANVSPSPMVAFSTPHLRARSPEDRRRLVRIALRSEELMNQVWVEFERAGLDLAHVELETIWRRQRETAAWDERKRASTFQHLPRRVCRSRLPCNDWALERHPSYTTVQAGTHPPIRSV